jgi:uncharacterized protein YfaA (DUF2138 family)
MTQKLEQLFDLPMDPSKEITEALHTAHALESQIPEMPEDQLDRELDELADKAVESFENLQSLGMNVESRFAAPIFDAASKMINAAVTAKLGKVQKKLKQTELAIRIQKMQQQSSPVDDPVQAEAKVWDRNELLKTFRQQ